MRNLLISILIFLFCVPSFAQLADDSTINPVTGEIDKISTPYSDDDAKDATGWSRNTVDGMVYLTNSTDYVGIGVSTPTAPLTVIPAGSYTWGIGGDSVYNYTDGLGVHHRVHKFTTVGVSSFTFPYGLGSAWVLVVAGGGAGGSGMGGGGGAGGYQENTSFIYTPGSTTSITVGGKGSGQVSNQGVSGSNSVLLTLTSVGGGGGGTGQSGVEAGANGGSGGGTGLTTIGLASPIGQGNNGGLKGGSGLTHASGGGGGASAVGGNGVANLAGNGGNGTQSSIDGIPTYYSGGGGGGANGGTPGNGGLGGGGAGGGYYPSSTAGANATGYGSGGGGGGNGRPGGNGSDGIVIISYVIPSLVYGLPQGAIIAGGLSLGKSSASNAVLDIQGVGSTTASTLRTTNNLGVELTTFLDSGNVGIGTSTPQNKLDVYGGAVIGTTYAGAMIAPTNGLLVSGNIGIGTSITRAKLDVEGTAYIKGNVGIGTITTKSTLDVNGSVGFSVVSTATNLALTNAHNTVVVTDTATITLPTAVGITGWQYVRQLQPLCLSKTTQTTP